MRFHPTDPPRAFQVGRIVPSELRDCGRVELEPDEQVTFVTEAGARYDVVRKSWGFYATPSLAHRLPAGGLRPALVRSPQDRHYVMLVERGHEQDFADYLRSEAHEIVTWLDTPERLRAVDRATGGAT